jgi:hypothetical protein
LRLPLIGSVAAGFLQDAVGGNRKSVQNGGDVMCEDRILDKLPKALGIEASA